MSDQISQADVWKHLKGAGTVMLTTEGDRGLRSRPMHIIQEQYEGKLYFFTSLSSPKVAEIEEEREVCVSGHNVDAGTFFSITGRAWITRDRHLIDELWSASAAAWFPKGKDDPDCALLVVDVDSFDLWENEENPVLFWYEVFKANLTGDTPDLGRVRHRQENGPTAQ